MTPVGQDTPSTRPYLIRALYEWCTENGFSPYLAVQVDASVRVPMDHVKNGEIVLNISFDATSGMQLGNEFIEFKARFGGVAREIVIPVSHVTAIYARENGQGMAFPAPAAPSLASPQAAVPKVPSRVEVSPAALTPIAGGGAHDSTPEPRTPGRGKLTRVK
ncbi:MAG: ClpXP protease specificity-enhancing factor [Hydrogenophaga sp.]|jgi:stringent starvation protein B|nr:ClpXP protease specificity-enhancing factor [Hydrogenophaga sp.]